MDAEALVAAERFSQQFEQLRKKHDKLPSLADLEKEFDLLDSVRRERLFTEKPLSFTTYQIMRWINGWTGMVHDLILPNPQNAVALEEASAYTDDERQAAVSVLNWMMYRNRCMNLLGFADNEAERVQFIADVYADWQSYKPRVRALVEKNKKMWDDKMHAPKEQHHSDYTN